MSGEKAAQDANIRLEDGDVNVVIKVLPLADNVVDATKLGVITYNTRNT